MAEKWRWGKRPGYQGAVLSCQAFNACGAYEAKARAVSGIVVASRLEAVAAAVVAATAMRITPLQCWTMAWCLGRALEWKCRGSKKMRALQDRLHSARLLPWIGRLHSTRQPPSPSPPLHPRPAMVLPPSAPPKMTTAPMQWSRGPRYATAPWGYRHHRHLHHHELGCNRTETTMTRSAFKLNWSCRRTSRGPCAGRAGLARSSSPHFPCPSTCEGILRTLAVPPRRPC